MLFRQENLMKQISAVIYENPCNSSCHLMQKKKQIVNFKSFPFPGLFFCNNHSLYKLHLSCAFENVLNS